MPDQNLIAGRSDAAGALPGGLDWIAAGTGFAFAALVRWQDQGGRDLAAAAASCDTILCGPAATAALPAELRPFLAPGATRRRQHAAAATATGALAEAWAARDAGVIFIRHPHPPLIGANGTLTEAADGLLAVPPDPAGQAALRQALLACAALGEQAYVAARDAVLEAVLAARRRGRWLHVLSLQQAATLPMDDAGVLVPPRPWPEASPRLANLCAQPPPAGPGGDDLADHHPPQRPTMSGVEVRLLAAAWAEAFGYRAEIASQALPLDRPCAPGCEVIALGARLAALREPRVGALRVEFRREWLLGPEALDVLSAPGTGWPDPAPGDLAGLLGGLLGASALLRA